MFHGNKLLVWRLRRVRRWRWLTAPPLEPQVKLWRLCQGKEQTPVYLYSMYSCIVYFASNLTLIPGGVNLQVGGSTNSHSNPVVWICGDLKKERKKKTLRIAFGAADFNEFVQLRVCSLWVTHHENTKATLMKPPMLRVTMATPSESKSTRFKPLDIFHFHLRYFHMLTQWVWTSLLDWDKETLPQWRRCEGKVTVNVFCFKVQCAILDLL